MVTPTVISHIVNIKHTM